MNISMYPDLLDLRNLGTVYKTRNLLVYFVVPVFRTSLTYLLCHVNKRHDLSASLGFCASLNTYVLTTRVPLMPAIHIVPYRD